MVIKTLITQEKSLESFYNNQRNNNVKMISLLKSKLFDESFEFYRVLLLYLKRYLGCI